MIRRFLNMIIGKHRSQYTPQQISDGLDLLVQKIAKIGLSVEIISPYFSGTVSNGMMINKINGKFIHVSRETMPLVIILQDVIRYHYGQLGRCIFDGQGRENNTASISVLVDQIFNNKIDGNQKKLAYKTEFSDIEKRLHRAEKYKVKLRKYCNKHFAHTDIKSSQAVESDLIKLAIPWNEFVGLINDAKSMLKNLYLVSQKPTCDFSEWIYEEYKNQFWKMIEYPEIKITTHLPKSLDG
jgi:hypothetical protein